METIENKYTSSIQDLPSKTTKREKNTALLKII